MQLRSIKMNTDLSHSINITTHFFYRSAKRSKCS
nr:MAG TPA: hypothetical protein [Caudoviricetes sp.]